MLLGIMLRLQFEGYKKYTDSYLTVDSLNKMNN